mgnify:CR=1 FL=1|tara:strand:+ start:836 stop:1066 length:231 start_codon:yes stop_codon:yes gene_type:complete
MTEEKQSVMLEINTAMTLIELIQAVEDGFTDRGVDASLLSEHDVEGMALQLWLEMRIEENWTGDNISCVLMEQINE